MKCLVVGFCLYWSSFSSYINHQNQNQNLQPQRRLRGFYFERMTNGLLSFLFLGVWKNNWVLKSQIRPEPSSSTDSVYHHHHHHHLKGPHATLKLQLQVHIPTSSSICPSTRLLSVGCVQLWNEEVMLRWPVANGNPTTCSSSRRGGGAYQL